MIPLGKQIQTSLRLISVSLSNVLYCIYDVSVVSRCTLYLNKILFTKKNKKNYDFPKLSYDYPKLSMVFGYRNLIEDTQNMFGISKIQLRDPKID